MVEGSKDKVSNEVIVRKDEPETKGENEVEPQCEGLNGVHLKVLPPAAFE